MVFTLHRYIFRELLRVFVLATVGLTLILSLGSLLRPIQQYGVGPQQVMHLLGYFLPITLTFVLPMSALFAAALVYGRFANDNELDACRASGVSLMTLIYPGVCLAIIVTITTLILSFHVVPAFVHRAEKAIKANAKQILFRNLQRKGYYELPDDRYRIYADQISLRDNMLMGVVIVESKETGVTKLITATSAKVQIDTHKEFNEVSIVAQQAYQIDDHGHQAYSSRLPISSRFASLLSDSIKFQSIEEIKKIKADMTHFYPVRQMALAARAQLATELLAEAIAEKITDSQDSYYQLSNQDRRIIFTAADCTVGERRTVRLIGPVKMLEFDRITEEFICRYDTNEGFIRLQDDNIDGRLMIVLSNPQWDKGGGIRGIAQRHKVADIALPQAVTEKIDDENLLATIDSTDSILKNGSSPLLEEKKSQLRNKIRATINQIRAEINSRLVFGLGCITLILIGIALGIIFKGGHLLSAFGTSSIPAGALIVCIIAGKDLTKNPSTPPGVGISVMWIGLLVLTLIALLIYRRLLKT